MAESDQDQTRAPIAAVIENKNLAPCSPYETWDLDLLAIVTYPNVNIVTTKEGEPKHSGQKEKEKKKRNVDWKMYISCGDLHGGP